MGTSTTAAVEKLAKILIVEDDGIIACDIRMMLEELGYHVSGIAASGAEALSLASTQSLDLVLMDVNIKGSLDGIQTAGLLAQRHRLPVVYLTAHTDDRTLARATETEPFGYLAKPITMEGIKLSVAVALTRNQAQKQVEEREQWLDAILNSTPEAVLIADANARVTFLNELAEEITGNSLETAQGRVIDEIVELLDEDGKPQRFADVVKLSSSNPRLVAGTLIRPHQTCRRVIVSVAPLKGNPGAGSVVLLQDISEYWEKEMELQKENTQLALSNEKLTYLSYSLSHDLQEPLRAINIYSELLTRCEGPLNGALRNHLDAIRQASSRMGVVMTSLLHYFQAGNLDRADIDLIDANGPFHDAMQNLSAAINASAARIEAATLPTVYAHPTALMLIFQNLLGNAIKYAGRTSPCVRISAERQGEYWQFTVEDNGMGFDPQHAENIFELFKRAHGKEQSGSGIGLATCQRLVEQHAGKIWAESQPGQGSRFHFTLPAVETEI